MTQDKITLEAVSAMDQAEFAGTFGHVVELSPWVAEQAWVARPFTTIDALLDAMMRAVRSASPETVRELLGLQTELAKPGYLAAASALQPGAPGMIRLKPGEGAVLATYNREYLAKFGFPVIMAVRGLRDVQEIMRSIDARMTHEPEAELETALTELGKIVRFRIWDLVTP